MNQLFQESNKIYRLTNHDINTFVNKLNESDVNITQNNKGVLQLEKNGIFLFLQLLEGFPPFWLVNSNKKHTLQTKDGLNCLLDNYINNASDKNI
tara:strand:+ start:993 stop:1277 length:285 start_codon:yes stop_codon:yes gene_type:complete